MYYRKKPYVHSRKCRPGYLTDNGPFKTDNRPVEMHWSVFYTGDPNSVIEEVRTDSSGNTLSFN